MAHQPSTRPHHQQPYRPSLLTTATHPRRTHCTPRQLGRRTSDCTTLGGTRSQQFPFTSHLGARGGPDIPPSNHNATNSHPNPNHNSPNSNYHYNSPNYNYNSPNYNSQRTPPNYNSQCPPPNYFSPKPQLPYHAYPSLQLRRRSPHLRRLPRQTHLHFR